jgi:hypothetical protein
MDNNRRIIIKRIYDTFTIQKMNRNKRYVIMRNKLITSDASREEKVGLYIEKEMLIDIIKSIRDDNIRLICATTPNTISIDVSGV